MKRNLPSFAIYDLETTGMSPEGDAIIQVAAVRMVAGTVIPDDFFFSYVNPGCPIPAWITGYTGITDTDVATAPTIAKILPNFSKWVGKSVLLAHNGNRFDIKFLQASCDRYSFEHRDISYCDSINLSWQTWGRRTCSHSLDAVMSRLHICDDQLQRHDARGDTLLLGKCVEKMLTLLIKQHGALPDLKLKQGYLPALPK